MIVCPARLDDRDAVYRFSSLLALHAAVQRPAFEQQFELALAHPSSTVLMAEDAGSPVGFLLGALGFTAGATYFTAPAGARHHAAGTAWRLVHDLHFGNAVPEVA